MATGLGPLIRLHRRMRCAGFTAERRGGRDETFPCFVKNQESSRYGIHLKPTPHSGK
jgi:hypothetical protein